MRVLNSLFEFQVERLKSRAAQLRYFRSLDSSTAPEQHRSDPNACVVRILGNDLAPRHHPTQTLDCLSFILEHEKAHEQVSKFFVLNRVFDGEREKELEDMLIGRGFQFYKIAFIAEEYAKQPLDFASFGVEDYFNSNAYRKENSHVQAIAVLWALRHKINYAMNLNGARNFAIKKGLSVANWTYPFDGQCFVPKDCLDQIADYGTHTKTLPYAIVPMRRVNANAEALLEPPAKMIPEEPQIGFSRSADHWFDSQRPYGVRDKADILRCLGYPGPWNRWLPKPFEANVHASFSQRYLYAVMPMPVVRLSSGHGCHDNEIDNKPRYQARLWSILQTISKLDDTFSVPSEHHSGKVIERYVL